MVAAVITGALAVTLITPNVIGAASRFVNQARARGRLTNNSPGHSAGYSAGRSAGRSAGHTVGRSKDSSTKSLFAVLADNVCRNGIPLMRPLASRLLRVKQVDRWCERISSALGLRVPFISTRSVCELELAASGIAALILFVLTGQLIPALAGALIPVLLSTQRATAWHRIQRIQLREQLPDALNAIGMCFSAGHSLQQALGQISSETPDPLGRQLRLAADDIDVGYEVSEALERLEQRTNCPDLRFVLVALDIQHMTGGSLREILEGAAASITDSFELARSLEVQTAQARMSARIVTMMPLVLLVLLSLVMPGYLATFFGSSSGFMLLIFALGLEALGIVLIRRILGIDLE